MRAEMLFQLGELSSARQVLEGCEIAPGTTDGGVRGIVAGDVVRRLVARPHEQLGPATVAAIAPQQDANVSHTYCKV